MIKIDIEAIWHFRRDDAPQALAVMLDFLGEVRTAGKLTSAARHAGMSYRHAWNLVEKWSAFFGEPLVTRHRGKGTTLTPLGEKLVWANQQLKARLGPQFANFAQELETEVNQLLPHSPSIIRVHASHGFAVSKLREILARESGVSVDLRYVSNQNSLLSLAHNTCELAGMHLPRGALRKPAIAACRERLDPRIHRVISFVTREIGLMVKRGNPLHINALEQLLDPHIRFVNRDHDSGTRQLFEQLLAQSKIDGKRINGYEQLEFTHSAVAAYVASDMADAGFGVEAAAREFNLDFIRLVTEDYYFVCREPILKLESVRRLLSIMRSEEFHKAIGTLPGYVAVEMGAIKTVKDFLAGADEISRM